MSQATGRERIALALFDGSGGLASALGALGAAGFDTGRMGIAGRESVIAGLRQAFDLEPPRPAAVALFSAGFSPLLVPASGELVLASAGPFWPLSRCLGSVDGGLIVTADWMPPQLRGELSQRIIHGATLFGVRPVSSIQQRACTEILLSHSSYRVHTHNTDNDHPPSVT